MTTATTNGNLISFADAEFEYEPFPIGVVRPVFDEDVYERLVETFPPVEKFVFKESLGNKYSLSEVNNPELYEQFIAENELWRRVHDEIKDPAFIDRVLEMLQQRRIDLGLRQNGHGRLQEARDALGMIRRGKRPQMGPRKPKLSARFEFSMLPANGGHIKPHTDAPQKIITLVMSMVRPGEWNPAFGGGTDMLKPKDPTKNFNHLNEYLGFDEVETLKTFEFDPNQCAVFVKTFNSLHSVQPMTGTDSDLMRRTLTVNIERLR